MSSDLLLSTSAGGLAITGVSDAIEDKLRNRLQVLIQSEAVLGRGTAIGDLLAKGQLKTNADIIGAAALALLDVKSQQSDLADEVPQYDIVGFSYTPTALVLTIAIIRDNGAVTTTEVSIG